MTFDDGVLFDGHRLTGMCVPPDRLGLVPVGQVWCRLLTCPFPSEMSQQLGILQGCFR